jgi:hypothetical protein
MSRKQARNQIGGNGAVEDTVSKQVANVAWQRRGKMAVQQLWSEANYVRVSTRLAR